MFSEITDKVRARTASAEPLEARGGLECERGQIRPKREEHVEKARQAEEDFLRKWKKEGLDSDASEILHSWLFKLNHEADPSDPESWRERLCVRDGGLYQ